MPTDTLTRSEDPIRSPSSSNLIPFLDLKAQYREIQDEIMEAVQQVFDSQHFILGPQVEGLEAEIADYVGSRFAIACASGSDALLLAMMALGTEPEDEVITSPFTFGATGGSIARLRARPVFVDIRPDSFNLDERQLESAITSRTRAIMPVHLFGLPANMDVVREIALTHNVAIIEDAAQAIGSRWKGQGIGTLGTVGCFSFFPSKNLGCAGDGGMMTTDDPGLAQLLRTLRSHGTKRKYHYEVLGMNSRLDALQAAILRVKLGHLDEWTRGRQRNAARYQELFAEYGLLDRIVLPTADAEGYHVYNQYTIRVPRRDQLIGYLRAQGVSTEVYYPSPLHLEPAFAYLGYRAGAFPQAEAACREVLSLPIYPELGAEKQRSIVAAIASFYSHHSLSHTEN